MSVHKQTSELSTSSSSSAVDISNLQESFSKQQKKISALKELVSQGKSTTSAQEKVKSIAQRLTLLKSKTRPRPALGSPHFSETASQKHDSQKQLPIAETQVSIGSQLPDNYSTLSPTSLKSHDLISSTSKSLLEESSGVGVVGSAPSAAGSEKILLLRQQMEQNRVLMAQRASSKQHLEQLVTQLREKFDTTQQCLEDTTELNKSMTNLSALAMYTSAVATRERHKSATDLTAQSFNLERERIKFLENRCRLLEKQLEKERHTNSGLAGSGNEENESATRCIKNVETQLLNLEANPSSLSVDAERLLQLAAENESLVNVIALKEEEINRLRIRKQPNDETCDIETKLIEIDRLQSEIAEKTQRIVDLEAANDLLEATRCDLTMKFNAAEERLQQLSGELATAAEQLCRAHHEISLTTEQCTALQDRLNQLQLQGSGSSTDGQVQAEMAKQIQELQDEQRELRAENDRQRATISANAKLEVSDKNIAESITELENIIEEQRSVMQSRASVLQQHEEALAEKTIELNVLNANFSALEEKLRAVSRQKPLLTASIIDGSTRNSGTAADEIACIEHSAELQQLKQKLDEANKATIKLKLKCKQNEKQVARLLQSSDLHGELVRQKQCNEQLQQHIAELEIEKGQWQLTATSSESLGLYQQQADTIKLLQLQKFEQLQCLEAVQNELDALRQISQSHVNISETARVKSEMSEIHLEERVQEQTVELQALQDRAAAREAELAALQQRLTELETQKQATDKKLEHYISENMELLDKVEKLSKSSSSAESIEIVERLTQQERAEIDRLQEAHNDPVAAGGSSSAGDFDCGGSATVSELTQTEMGAELSESLLKLREESSELMNKIELFTTERREVLDKMEHLTTEKQELQRQVETLHGEQRLAEQVRGNMETRLEMLTKENELLASQVAEAESAAHKSPILQDRNSLQHTSEVMAMLDSSSGASLFEKCEKCLSKLHAELENYRRANDKNAKFSASKKLAKEAKNSHAQLSELLQKVREASCAVETVTVVETVVAVTAPNGKALAEYEQLTAQNRELKATVDELRRVMQRQRDETRATNRLGLSEVNVSEFVEVLEGEKQHSADESQQLDEVRSVVAAREIELMELQATVNDVQLRLQEALQAASEKFMENTALQQEVDKLRRQTEDFDRQLNDKEMCLEQQVEQSKRLRLSLEAKCETYAGELDIVRTLVAEQKQQLIESYQESEHAINSKLLDLQQRDEVVVQLSHELQLLKAQLADGNRTTDAAEQEGEKLRDALRINKTLVGEQLNELAAKQDTIDMLNQQLIDLYKMVEDRTLSDDAKTDELECLRKDNDEQKAVVDKLLSELHLHRESTQCVSQLRETNRQLETSVQDMEQRNKEQLEKLKKFAANLKKRTVQCQDYEAKLSALEKGALEAAQTKEHVDDALTRLNNEKARLSERVAELERTGNDNRKELAELQQALQVKTMQTLEAMEQRSRLEQDLQAAHATLEQKQLQVMELQSALSASEDRESFTANWGDTAAEVAAAGSLANDKTLTKELNAKVALTVRLEDDLAFAKDNLAMKVREIELLHGNLIATQEQITSDADAKQRLEQQLAELRETLATLKEQCSQGQAQLLLAQEQRFEDQEAHQERTIVMKQLQGQVQMLGDDLKAKSLKFEKSKAIIKERNTQIHRLQAQVKDLQTKLSGQPEEETQFDAVPPLPAFYRTEYEALQQAHGQLKEEFAVERANFADTLSRLETLHDGIKAKLQEQLSYIESLEQENGNYKAKTCQLEECVATFEERRDSMERRAHLLGEQLQTRAHEFERTEDALVYRLNMLAEHDDVIGRRLLESQEEKEALQERLDRLQREHSALSAKQSMLEKQYQIVRVEEASKAANEQQALRDQLAAAEVQLRSTQTACDAKLALKTTEVDELECELSDQLDKMNAEKRALLGDLERSRDDSNEQKDEIVRLRESLNAAEQGRQELEREATWLRMQSENVQQDQFELQELRMQTLQDKTECDNLRHQIETLAANHDIELEALRTQIAELDTLRMQVGQNQTDDQVFIETENKRLTDLLAEREATIENYQRQNLLMQIDTVAAVQTPVDLASSQQATPPPQFSEEGHQLQLSAELITLRESNNELQRQLLQQVTENNQLRAVSRTVDHGAVSSQLYFAVDHASPFDDLAQMRNVAPMEASSLNCPQTIQQEYGMPEQRTIEDLQRNVSDLEKHAQELENRLAVRTQRQAEDEERLNQAEQRCQQRDSELRQMREQLAQMEQEFCKRKQQICEETTAKIEQQYATRLTQLESMLQQRDRDIQAKQELVAVMPDLERKILSDGTISTVEISDGGPTLDMFFGNATATSISEFDSALIAQPTQATLPVVEEMIVPRKAYICQPAGVNSAMDSALTLVDGWGDSWDGNEELAEEFHFSKTQESSPLVSRDHQLLVEERHRMEMLQTALDDCEVEKQELQMKCSKMLKKLKEYRLKVDELQLARSASVESNSIFGDLDATIQEELKTQLVRLEIRLAEQQKSQEAAALEKEKLLKRLDVLSAGNERMTEMKERQDMDVQMYQARIRELQEKLNRLDDWGTGVEECTIRAHPLESIEQQEPTQERERDTAEFSKRLVELNTELQELRDDRQELQAMLEEERANTARAEETTQILEKKLTTLNNAVTSNATEESNRYAELQAQFDAQLQANVTGAELKQKELQQKINAAEAEVLLLRKRSEVLEQANCEQQVAAVSHECKLTHLEKLEVEHTKDTPTAVQNDEIAAVLLEKEAEILHLKQRVEDLIREDQTEKLVLEILSKNQEIHLLKMEVKRLEDGKLESNVSPQNEEQMQTTLSSKVGDNEIVLNQEERIITLQSQLHELQVEKVSMEEELRVLNNHIMSTLEQEDKLKAAMLTVDVKDIEIAELRGTLETLRATPATTQADIVALNVQWETLVEQRCSEIAHMWREHLKQRESDFEVIERRLLEQITSLKINADASMPLTSEPQLIKSISVETVTSTAASESTSPSVSSSAVASKDATPLRTRYDEQRREQREQDDDDADAIMERMQAALEGQEMEIVTLKEQLAIRSAEYARLAAQYDPFKLHATSSHRGMLSSASTTGTGGLVSLDSSQTQRNVSPNDATMVPKTEFDLALYMLHQRDMRCEEMTVELVQLLEERDTLQLKLSNTLRQLESFKALPSSVDPTTASQTDTIGSGTKPRNSDSPTKQSAVSDNGELTQKLVQLQTVDHSKDKIIKEDRDQRIRQMEKIQQDVAKMPPAAVSELIGSDLSQSSQSPSSVLLNWLWGGNQPTNSTGNIFTSPN